ncbi:hypothetical protein APHAL10511_000763 [Amanita phalloides]|nr:hypothetical protein APHAL10511_000763 [Amanita phalloides]
MSTVLVDYGYWNAIYIGYHFRFASLSLLMYDYFLTLDDEVELFWKRPWTIATHLFFWTRYGGMFLLISTLSLATIMSDPIAVRKAWFTLDTLLGTINTWVTEGILFLRLYALYNRSRRVALAAASVFIVQILSVSAIAVMVMTIVLPSTEAVVFGGITYCEIRDDRPRRVAWGYWVCFAIFEAVILFFTIRKGNDYYRRQKESSFRLSNVVSTLYWDSVYYSIIIEIFYILNIILNLINDKNYLILSGPGFTLPVIMGGRMMINVRRTMRDNRYCQHPSTPSQVSIHVDDSGESPPPSWALSYI